MVVATPNDTGATLTGITSGAVPPVVMQSHRIRRNCQPEAMTFLPVIADTMTFLPVIADTMTFLPVIADTMTFLPVIADTMTFLPVIADTMTFSERVSLRPWNRAGGTS